MKYSFIENMLPAPRNGGFSMEGYWVWCGSPIKDEDGTYHLFASRWPNTYPMHPGWLLASEIVRATAQTPVGPYQFQEVVLPPRGAEYWDGRATHCPSIHKVGQQYVLIYTGITHPFPPISAPETLTLNSPETIVTRASKRVGAAYADSLSGPWTRLDHPILPTRPESFDSFMISNPAMIFHEDLSVSAVYKARGYLPMPYTGEPLHGKMTLGAGRASSFHGPFQRRDQPIFDQHQYHLEDPFIWKDENGYHMIAKDMEGTITGEQHAGAYATSPDGLHWRPQEGYKAYSREILWDDGTIQRMGSLERPSILFEDGVPTHMFFATADGPGRFTNASRTWNMVIPLKH